MHPQPSSWICIDRAHLIHLCEDPKMTKTQHHHLQILVLAALVSMPLMISFCGYDERANDAQYSLYHYKLIHQQSLVKGCAATCAFALATSLRTVIMAPLTRLHEKRQQYISHPLEWTINTMSVLADNMEEFSHKVWEGLEREAGVWNETSVNPFIQVPEIDLNASVPCGYGDRKKSLLGKFPKELPEDHKWCQLRDVITRDVLIDYASAQFDNNFNLATHPIILRIIIFYSRIVRE